MAQMDFGRVIEVHELCLNSIYAFLRTVLAAYCRGGKKIPWAQPKHGVVIHFQAFLRCCNKINS